MNRYLLLYALLLTGAVILVWPRQPYEERAVAAGRGASARFAQERVGRLCLGERQPEAEEAPRPAVEPGQMLREVAAEAVEQVYGLVEVYVGHSRKILSSSSRSSSPSGAPPVLMPLLLASYSRSSPRMRKTLRLSQAVESCLISPTA